MQNDVAKIGTTPITGVKDPGAIPRVRRGVSMIFWAH